MSEKFKKKVEETKKEIKEVEEDVKKSDEEEISIDFGKIKKIFTPKEKKKKEEAEEQISIDFSKVKKFFKRPKKEAKGEEEIDLKEIGAFLKKFQIVFLLLIPIILSILLRVQPAYLPITDDWATNSVYTYFRSQIRAQIDQQYPNLPDQNKNRLIESEFQKFLSEQKTLVDDQIKGTSEYFKSRLQDENGQTYLLAIDPYFWWRHAKNIIENGHPGDELRNVKTGELCTQKGGDCIPWDNHMFAPKGREATPDQFHAYFEVFIFKIIRAFNRDVTLKEVAFFVPVIVVALSVIPAFFIAKRIAGNFAGVVAGIIVAINPSFLTRTAAGFADTDAYNVFFPLLITWLFLIAFETKNNKYRLLFSAIAGFTVGLFSFAWTGWWYIFDFLILASLIYLIYYVVFHSMELKKGLLHFLKLPATKNTIIVLVIFFILSAVSVTIFQGFDNFRLFLFGPLGFATLKTVGIKSVWPNVYTTVAEQNPGSFAQVVATMGGKFLFIVGLFGVLLTMTKKDQHGKIDIKYSIILTIWLIATIYASIKGVRYMLMVVPAFSIAFGVSLGLIYNYISRWISKELKVNTTISKVIVIFLLCLLLIGPFKSARVTAINEIPSMNDAWYASLDKINRNATPDAIINSWWDFGHWFKAIGDRAVTFDGTSQNTPMAHWIGNSLLTGDEKIAAGILRMLDCSSNDAFEELNEVLDDTAESIDLLYEIIVQDKNKAIRTLKNYVSLQGKKLSNDKINKIIARTHCEPPENYYITSDDMIGKSGVWAHFGSWNFDRALIYNTLKKKGFINNKEKSIQFLKQRFDYSDDKAENIYFDFQSITSSEEANNWIAPWPSYASGLVGCAKQEDNITITCNMGQFFINVNLTTMEADIPTQQGTMHPNTLVYPTKEGIEIKEFNNTIGISMVLIPREDNNFNAILMAPQLAPSMFTRLYFMDGHGLEHFKLFSYERSVTGNQIYVWKVDWDGGEKNMLSFFKEPELIEEIQQEQNNSKVRIEIE